MARNGYLIMDSDLHMMEPDDLWTRYLDEPYRTTNPPRFFGGQQEKLTDNPEDKGNTDAIAGMEVQGLAIPAHATQMDEVQQHIADDKKAAGPRRKNAVSGSSTFKNGSLTGSSSSRLRWLRHLRRPQSRTVQRDS